MESRNGKNNHSYKRMIQVKAEARQNVPKDVLDTIFSNLEVNMYQFIKDEVRCLQEMDVLDEDFTWLEEKKKMSAMMDDSDNYVE